MFPIMMREWKRKKLRASALIVPMSIMLRKMVLMSMVMVMKKKDESEGDDSRGVELLKVSMVMMRKKTKEPSQ